MKRMMINNNSIMLTTLFLLIVICLLMNNLSIAYADNIVEYEKSFITIEIQDGDTLTSIAHTYATSEVEYNQYIEEVMSINNLQNDTIHDGCYLLIPVYRTIYEN